MSEAVSGVGETLSRAREARGLALAEVAQQLKFNPRHLEALEQERFDALPGVTFARGMVRGYARLLRLDPEPLLLQLAGRFAVPDAERLAERFHQPVPFSDSGRRSTVVYLALSIAVLGLVGLVAYEWHRETSAPEQVAARPTETPRPVAIVAMAPQAGAVVEPLVAAPAALKHTDDAKSILAGGGRIVLRCEADSWIEIKDAADRTLISSLNSAGTERVVEGKAPFSLIIGNAQHVRVSYNNKPVDLTPHTKVEVARFTLK